MKHRQVALHVKNLAFANFLSPEITYRNSEDELFEQGAEWKLEWNAENDIRQDEQNGSGWDDDELYAQYRMLAVFKYDKLKELIQMLPMWLTTR